MSLPKSVVAVCLLLSSAARAEDKPATPPAAKPPPAETQAAATAQPEKIEAVARGLFVEVRVGGGYMVMNQKLKADPVFPGIEGQSEKLGPGALMHMALGFDLTDNLALQLIGGNELVSGGRNDRVRDLGLTFGGAALRLAFDIDDRLDFVIAGGGALTRVDNGVEKPTSGPAAFASIGIEYYVHVRHFSVGLDATVLAPLSPMRVFVGLGPQLKYTF